MEPNDLLPELYDATCATDVKCGFAESVDACMQSQDTTGGGSFQSLLDAIDDGTVKYDSGKAQDCVDNYRDADCDFTGFHSDEDSPCNHVFTGTVQPGGACVIDAQCAGSGVCTPTDTSCDSTMACCPGTCSGGDTVSATGGPCDDTHICGPADYCSAPSGSDSGTCTAPITTEGTACDQIDACANPMYCDIFANEPTCKRPAASGEACMPDDLLPCIDNRDFCDATMTCTHGVDDGQPCPTGAECLAYSTCVAGTCVANGGPGAACGADTDPDCAGNLSCDDNGQCALPDASPTCSL